MLAPSVLGFQNSGPHLQEFSSKKNYSVLSWPEMLEKEESAAWPWSRSLLRSLVGFVGVHWCPLTAVTRVGGEFLGPGG